MGYKKAVDTKPIKYGRAQESHKKLHKRFQIKDSGLIIGEHAFTGASPGLIVECAYHVMVTTLRPFNPSFWQHMSTQIIRFRGLYVAPELITQNVWSQ
ncbi:hypothetical protein LSH36_427g06036 [Paralvinella palmiformis]|uniref:Uncharacterized protein n=1 Tax=Paralvinella palmiformis TaxID=53620 RepID=A0AAD9JBR2_9ANNE|nr:hypothetical protein LSH36_427g06036 [Paralvinella palmiformis]